MKWRVSIRPRAEGDLQQAWQWYEREQRGLGDKFLAEMRELIQNLQAYAERTPEYYRGFHRLLAPRFPHKIFYRFGVTVSLFFASCTPSNFIPTTSGDS